ncbi:hypothetical protein [Providencia sp. PROV274]|uniref:hypothetical protein n=1 Tax=Providencia sp. PROV274 TaxID=2949961 RepID=UPI00234AEA53|nr:hypothetical protein [Providencia sp. PROV274]
MAGMYYLGSGLSVGLGTPSLTILSDELKKELQSHAYIIDKIFDSFDYDLTVDFTSLSTEEYKICYMALCNIVNSIKRQNDREKIWIVSLWNEELHKKMQLSPLYKVAD